MTIAEQTYRTIATSTSGLVDTLARLLVEAKRDREIEERAWDDLPEHRKLIYRRDARYILSHLETPE